MLNKVNKNILLHLCPCIKTFIAWSLTRAKITNIFNTYLNNITIMSTENSHVAASDEY